MNENKNWKSGTILAAVLVIAVAVRWIFLNWKIMNYDELPELLFVVLPSKNPVDIFEAQIRMQDYHTFFYRFFQVISQMIFGVKEMTYTAPSLIAGVVEVYLVSLFASRLGNKTLGWIAAFFVATSFIHAFFSVSPRVYPLYGCISLFFYLRVFNYIDGQKQREQLRAVVMASLVLFATSYVSTILVVTTLLFFLLESKLTPKIIGAFGGIVLIACCFAPTAALFSFLYPWSFDPDMPVMMGIGSNEKLWYLIAFFLQAVGLFCTFEKSRQENGKKYQYILVAFFVAMLADVTSVLAGFNPGSHRFYYKDFLTFFFVAQGTVRVGEWLLLAVRNEKIHRRLVVPVFRLAVFGLPVALLLNTENYMNRLRPEESVALVNRIEKKSSIIVACIPWAKMREIKPYSYEEELRAWNIGQAVFLGIRHIDQCDCEAFLDADLNGYKNVYYVTSSTVGVTDRKMDQCFIDRLAKGRTYTGERAIKHKTSEFSIYSFWDNR